MCCSYQEKSKLHRKSVVFSIFFTVILDLCGLLFSQHMKMFAQSDLMIRDCQNMLKKKYML
ncbi:hypothetical protein BpHYR1_010473 [Brachionus plicatilis]|uniref:Uncharacterized protein n=1 Tax=Brachionus plicatilis TaxID=10195 RepID=A0A3M7S0G0_BRAPC|nr:hypothetical protein BpHYR1_010473 [Brachionus plicatilis]